MSFAGIIRDMAAAGASPEAIAIAVEAIELAQIAADAPRAAARARKQRQRERERDMSRDSHAEVTGQERDEPAPSPSPLPFPQTPKPTPHPLPHLEGSDARTRKARASAWPCPDEVDPQHWADVLANRKSKRLANTPTAYAGMLRDLAKFADEEWPRGRIIQHAAERGWGAIFDPRPNTGGRHGQRSHHDRPRSRGLLGAVFDAEHGCRAGQGV